MNFLRTANLAELLSLYDSSSLDSLYDSTSTPKDLMETLIDKERYMEANLFCANSLALRPVIIWSYFILNHAIIEYNEIESKVRHDIENWLVSPTEENRYNFDRVLDKTGIQSSIGWLAQAIFWSSGSLSPKGAPESPPPQGLMAKAIFSGVQLACFTNNGAKYEALCKLYSKIGYRIINGMNPDRLLKIGNHSMKKHSQALFS